MLSNPTIAFKNWIFQQFDQEIGLRTILKPGITDSAVLKLNTNKFLSAKLDGNSKLCYLIHIKVSYPVFQKPEQI
jgi:phosphoribosylformylglycinamidine synthase